MSEIERVKASELEEIARRANEHFEAAETKIIGTKRTANEAVKEIILCGQALQLAKDNLKHGRWLKWLALYCPNISHDTASRYMRASNIANVRNLEDARSISQVLKVCEPTDHANSQPKSPHVFDVPMIETAFTRLWTRLKNGEVIESFTPEEKAKVAQVIEPIGKLYLQLTSQTV